MASILLLLLGGIGLVIGLIILMGEGIILFLLMGASSFGSWGASYSHSSSLWGRFLFVGIDGQAVARLYLPW
jgi:hypothetical protein